jgi:hypothetical protein
MRLQADAAGIPAMDPAYSCADDAADHQLGSGHGKRFSPHRPTARWPGFAGGAAARSAPAGGQHPIVQGE